MDHNHHAITGNSASVLQLNVDLPQQSSLGVIGTTSETVPDDEPSVTLSGVWTSYETEPGLSVKYYNDGAAWIEAQLLGDTVRFTAKEHAILGGVMHAVQPCGEERVSASAPSQIQTANTNLELKLANVLAGA